MSVNLRRRPVGPQGYKTALRCDRCGQPARWCDRVVSPCCVLGEALCDRCEASRSQLILDQDTFWSEVRADARWLYQKSISRFIDKDDQK